MLTFVVIYLCVKCGCHVVVSAGVDGDADVRGGVHLHGHRLQLLPQVLHQGGGRGGGLQVSRHGHGQYTLQSSLDLYFV